MPGLLFRSALVKARRVIGRLFYAPQVQIDDVGPLITLGSHYGGWTFRDGPELLGSTVICAGLGEDASFDVEFANRYSAKVVILDPTPRAIEHFHKLTARIGRNAEVGYSSSGCQPVESYDLDGIVSGQLVLVDKALWIEKTKLKFYKPPNPDHVSHSISNFQNDYATDTPWIEVESVTLADVIAAHGLDDVKLLKLDIEGAEIELLGAMLDQEIHPGQLLIEFDELMLRTRKALLRWQQLDARLRAVGYRCGHFDGRSCFLYVLSSLAAPLAAGPIRNA